MLTPQRARAAESRAGTSTSNGPLRARGKGNEYGATGGHRQGPGVCRHSAECTGQTVKQGGSAEIIFVLDKRLSGIFLFAVITCDNCRGEDPEQIIGDILAGMDAGKPYTVIKDRREAVRYAVFAFDEEWVLLLAGKGHEKYEITRSAMIGFDEAAIVRDAALEKMRTDNYN